MTKPTKGGTKKAKAPSGCPVCGGTQDEKGFCATGGGYPGTMACPFVCVFCHQSLSWDGGCSWCFGTHTPSDRATWTFPGDEYQREKGHWVMVAGPQKACSPEQNSACRDIVRAVVDKEVSEIVAQDRIQTILQPEVPF